MVHFYDSLPDNLRDWALAQRVFFTASAPLDGRHVNLSPKGLVSATFAVLDGNRAAYLDTAGSGVETVAHVYENGRVTVMFCSLDARPRIMRLFCTGRVVERADADAFRRAWRSMGKPGEPMVGARAVIMLRIWKVQTSCGYGVPVFRSHDDHASHLGQDPTPCSCYEDRPTLEKALANFDRRGKLAGYLRDMNSRSLDGLLGLREARRARGENMAAAEAAAWLGRQLRHPAALALGVVVGLALPVCLLSIRALLLLAGSSCRAYMHVSAQNGL
ncbi:hypothetical protein CDD83_1220 [Cordyceps sp. RAO-2017]|nr:hypothetical protein CDD83_1220 [Cordyceps sp. RAO-2017]